MKTIPDVIKYYKRIEKKNKITFLLADISLDIENGVKITKRRISNILKMKVNKTERVSDYLSWNGNDFDVIKENKITLFKVKSLYNDYKDIDFKLLEKAKQGEK